MTLIMGKFSVTEFDTANSYTHFYLFVDVSLPVKWCTRLGFMKRLTGIAKVTQYLVALMVLTPPPSPSPPPAQ